MPFVERGPSTAKWTTPAGPRADNVIEGRCASCGGELERRKADGWCASCGVGWAYKSTGPGEGEITLTLEFDTSAWSWSRDGS